MPATDEPFWTVPRAVIAVFVAFAVAGVGVMAYPRIQYILSTWNGDAEDGVHDPCAEQTEESGVSVFCNRGDVQRAPSEPRGTIIESPKAPSAPRGTIVE
jgi:hypothetical protein